MERNNIHNRNLSLGIQIPRSQAEKARRLLIKTNTINSEKKIVTETDFVFIPIVENSNISEILNNLNFTVIEREFPDQQIKQSISDTLKQEFPKEPWDAISIKFDQIGEIALTKLDSKITSRKMRKKLGELILESHPKILSVINKLDIIEGISRVHPIEHLAGEEKYNSWHMEYGVQIRVDLQNAYFNPRLAEEHRRVSLDVREGEQILDLFTGVGPFALHCTKQQNCTVYAVDINPHAITNLQKSINKNRLKGEIYPIIGDSGEIFQLKHFFDRIILNLPEKSINYLPMAAELVRKDHKSVVHLYQFSKKTESPEQSFINSIHEKLNNKYSFEVLRLRVGREVSPSRIQMNADLRINNP